MIRPIRIRSRITKNSVHMFHIDLVVYGDGEGGAGVGGAPFISDPVGARALRASPIRLFGTS